MQLFNVYSITMNIITRNAIFHVLGTGTTFISHSSLKHIQLLGHVIFPGKKLPLCRLHVLEQHTPTFSFPSSCVLLDYALWLKKFTYRDWKLTKKL